MAQVAWPGVPPFFLGAGEALVAQEPYIQVPEDPEDTLVEAAADDTPEAKAEAEETLVDTPMEAAEEGGTTEAGIDEDYVVYVTAA